METIKTGILTVSDSCSVGQATDFSGDNLENILNAQKLVNATVFARKCVADDFVEIQNVLQEWCDVLKLDLILTTGGTGFSPRDVTPEATRAVIEREAPGFSFALMEGSLKSTKFAMLSRLVCGIRGTTLILNFPGSQKASKECLSYVCACIPHAIDQLRGRTDKVAKLHITLQSEPTKVETYASETNKEKSCICEDVNQARHSPYPMIKVADAQKIVLREAYVLKKENINMHDSLGRVLAQDIRAEDPLPPFPASMKDGYAVLANDGKGPRLVLSTCTAGCKPFTVNVVPGTCVRISTGAPVPCGADAVVQIEDTSATEKSGLKESTVNILVEPKPHQDIRAVGSDIEKGEKVISAGERIGPTEIGLLATVGVRHVVVYSMPVVAVLSTGNELSDATGPLGSGLIRDSNRPSLIALLEEHGFPNLDIGIARDSHEDLLKKLVHAFKYCDILVSTGGVSMGEKDLVKHVLEKDFKATICFGRISMKPGKPTTFATLNYDGKKKLVFGLPGNPVSAMVASQLLLLPCLRKMSGWIDPMYTVIKAELEHEVMLDPRPEYQRATLKWNTEKSIFTAKTTGKQISSRLMSMRHANALLMFPARSDNKSKLDAGSKVDAILIDRF